jgi:mRNA-degrading endonuclease toxin of MazEF toxin-antitoxin module
VSRLGGKPFSARDAANRARGLADKQTVDNMVQGAVFSIADKLVLFPNERQESAGPRSEHRYRPVIVVQSVVWNRRAKPNTVLVVPCSSSSTPGPADVSIPEGEPAFSAASVAYTCLAQPILKSDLGKYHGMVSAPLLNALRESIASLFGIAQTPLFAKDVSAKPSATAASVTADVLASESDSAD